MAILFVSPQKTQRMLMLIVISLLIVFLVGFSLTIFWPQFSFGNQDPLLNPTAYQAPDIQIDFRAVDSNQFKNLEVFSEVQIEFNYIAKDENDKQIIGVIMATNKDNAQIILEQMGLKASSLEEKNLGRNEPFSPYY